MKRQGLLVASLAVAAIAAIGPYSAQAAPAQRTRIELIQAVTLRDGGSDVVLSDGLGTYAYGQLSSSYVQNFEPSVVDADVNTVNQDRLFVRTPSTAGSRTMTLSSDLASTDLFGPGSTQPIPCLSAHILFESASTPDWWEALGSDGTSVRGWGNVRCYVGPHHGYQIFYQRGASLAGPGECLTLTRTSRSTLVLDADHGASSPLTGHAPCNGDVQKFEYTTDENGNRTGFRGLPLGVESAPYEATLDFGRGKGKGKS